MSTVNKEQTQTPKVLWGFGNGVYIYDTDHNEEVTEKINQFIDQSGIRQQDDKMKRQMSSTNNPTYTGWKIMFAIFVIVGIAIFCEIGRYFTE